MSAAGAVQRLANSMMYDLLHKETVQQGLDPSEYAMFSYGGTAGMHMTSIGQELGVSRVVVPNAASVYGAFGLVNADVIYSDATSRVMPLPGDPDVVNEVFSALENESRAPQPRRRACGTAVPPSANVDVRYRQQVHTITTAVPVEGPLSVNDLDPSAIDSTSSTPSAMAPRPASARPGSSSWPAASARSSDGPTSPTRLRARGHEPGEAHVELARSTSLRWPTC